MRTQLPRAICRPLCTAGRGGSSGHRFEVRAWLISTVCLTLLAGLSLFPGLARAGGVRGYGSCEFGSQEVPTWNFVQTWVFCDCNGDGQRECRIAVWMDKPDAALTTSTTCEDLVAGKAVENLDEEALATVRSMLAEHTGDCAALAPLEPDRERTCQERCQEIFETLSWVCDQIEAQPSDGYCDCGCLDPGGARIPPRETAAEPTDCLDSCLSTHSLLLSRKGESERAIRAVSSCLKELCPESPASTWDPEELLKEMREDSAGECLREYLASVRRGDETLEEAYGKALECLEADS